MNRGFFIVFGIVASVLILFIIGANTRSDRGVGTGAEYSPAYGPATMAESEDLYRQLDEDIRFTALRRDLAYFARATINTYKSGEVADVVFRVTGKVSRTDKTVSFSGEFGEDSDEITVNLDLLRFERMKVSITNNERSINIDSELPSNSKENQFIASLPVDSDGYRIGYVSENETYQINIFERDSTLINQANQKLIDSLGIVSIKRVPVEYSLPTAPFEE